MEYFHKERPDVIPPATLCSMAGLASTIPEDEHVDDDDISSPSTPTTSPGTISEPGSQKGRRVTAVSMLQAMSERQEGRMEISKRQQVIEEQRNSLLAKAIEDKSSASTRGQDKSSTSARFPGTSEQFGIAVAYLGHLQTHDDVEDDEDAMYVLSCVADVVHGSDPGPAQRMAACVWALAQRDLPAARAVSRLRAFVPGTAVGGGGGSGAGDGGFIRRT